MIKKSIFFLYALLLMHSSSAFYKSYHHEHKVIEGIYQISGLIVGAYPLYQGICALMSYSNKQSEGFSLDDLKKYSKLNFERITLKTPYGILVYPATSIDSNELVSIIGKVAKELNIEKLSAKIRYNFYTVYCPSPSNPGAASLDSVLYLYSLFTQLSIQSKEFVLAHEFTHIKERHSLLLALTKIMSPLVIYGSFQLCRSALAACFGGQQDKSKLFSIIDIGLLCNPGLHWLMHRKAIGSISRYLEKRADLSAAYSLEATAGGMAWLGISPLSYLEKKVPSELSEDQTNEKIKTTDENEWKKYRLKTEDWLNEKFDFHRHPSDQERMAYLIECYEQLYNQEIASL